MIHPSGYSIRVWMALQAVRIVQGEMGVPPVLLHFESIRDWFNYLGRRKVKLDAESMGVQALCFPLFPKVLPKATWINLKWCGLIVSLLVRLLNIGVVHAQSHFAAGGVAAALNGISVKMVFDVHGVDIEERVGDGRVIENSSLHCLLLNVQRQSILRADHILVVTEALGAHINHASGYQKPFSKVPCVTSLPISFTDFASQRNKARCKLGVNNRKVVVYLGGASSWQQPELMVDTFSHLHRKLSVAYFLVITNEVAVFQRLLKKKSLPTSSYVVLNLPHHEVAAHAIAGDVGLLLREDNLINRVASPTKFAEYLQLGIPVLLTNVIEDYAQIVLKYGIGRVCKAKTGPEGIAEELESLLQDPGQGSQALMERCQRVVEDHLSFDSILSTYRCIYTGEVKTIF